jgi:hypothetical protein
MIVDINRIVSTKLSYLDHQVREIQQALVIYGIGNGRVAHRLQHIVETIEDAKSATGRP